MKYKGSSQLSGQACNYTLSRKLAHPQTVFCAPLSNAFPKIHIAGSLTAYLDTFLKEKPWENVSRVLGSYVNSIWCVKTFFPAHGEEEEFTSSDYCLSCKFGRTAVVKKGVKKIRIAWSNECAGMRRNYTDHDWDSQWEILPTDLAGTIWNGKIIVWHIWGTPCS